MNFFVCAILFATWQSTTVPNFSLKAQPYQKLERCPPLPSRATQDQKSPGQLGLNNNPVLVARHFQYKIQVFFQRDQTWCSFGKNKISWYSYWIPRKRQPTCPFRWIFNAPNIENKAACKKFIEKTINVQLPDHLKDPELFELVKTYQVHTHSVACRKYNKNECCFSYGCYFTEKTIIANPLGSKFRNE